VSGSKRFWWTLRTINACMQNRRQETGVSLFQSVTIGVFAGVLRISTLTGWEDNVFPYPATLSYLITRFTQPVDQSLIVVLSVEFLVLSG
jgi:hypothetical protein